jgi:hypothetical protein
LPPIVFRALALIHDRRPVFQTGTVYSVLTDCPYRPGMRGWVSGFILLGLGAGLGWLGVVQLYAVIAGAAPAEAAPLSALGALIVLVPGALFAGIGASSLPRRAAAAQLVDSVPEDCAPLNDAVVIRFPRRSRFAAD